MTDPKRLSLLPRSILKQKFKDDDTTNTSHNLTMSQIQFPTEGITKEDILDGNNTTSRISAAISKGNRRVSFAPDVTLHKFEFIPQSIQNVREPRRKSALKLEVAVAEASMADTKNDNDNSGETMEFTSPIGSIFQKLEFPSEPKNDGYQPVFDKEVSMDITQLFAKHSAKPDDNVVPQETSTAAEEEEENGNEDQVLEETMDLTEPQKRRFNEEESMEITDQIRMDAEKPTLDADSESAFKLPKIPAITEETMEFTNVQAPLEMRESQIVSSTQLEPTQLPQSKRRKLSNGGYQSPVKLQVPVQVQETPEQKENIDAELTEMERLSPIPLATNSLPKPKNVGSPILSKTSKHVLSDTQSQSGPISLQTFFDAANIKFNVDTQINEFQIDLKSTNNIEHVPSNIIYQALYCKIPILEIQAFTAKELTRRILQSRNLLKSLREQIASNEPPRLIKEYFEADTDTRYAINEKLELVTIMARLQSEKVWFEWRSQHLKGIKTVLEENIAILVDENAQIMKYMNEINDVKIRVSDIKQVLMKELDVLRQHNDVFSNKKENITTLLKVNKLKGDLRENMLKVSDLNQLTTKKDQLTQKIQDAKLEMSKVNEEIAQLRQDLKQSKVCTEYDVAKLKLVHQLYQSISGIKFRKLVGPVLSVSLHDDKVIVTADLSKIDQPSCISFSIREERIDQFEREFINCWINSCQRTFINGLQCISSLQRQLIDLSIVISEFKKLKLVFPATVNAPSQNSQIKYVTFQHLDYKYHCKVALSLPMERFIDLICHSKNATINVNIIYGEEKTARNLTSNLIKKYEKVFKWLSNCNIAL